ncbi:MAG: DUF2911 domain-containing protein [Terriglobales bacterium]
MRRLATCFVIVSGLALSSVAQQPPSTDPSESVFCTFEDGQQLKVQYSKLPEKRQEQFREGRIWEPGGSPMVLFTETTLTLGNAVIPEGAYSLYILPQKQNWILVVNRNVAFGAKYDQTKDLVRSPMQIGQSDTSITPAQIALAHVSAKECNLRVYYGKSGAWAEFHEK